MNRRGLWFEIDCHVCRGTGKAWRKRRVPEPCPACGGSGRTGVIKC